MHNLEKLIGPHKTFDWAASLDITVLEADIIRKQNVFVVLLRLLPRKNLQGY